MNNEQKEEHRQRLIRNFQIDRDDSLRTFRCLSQAGGSNPQNSLHRLWLHYRDNVKYYERKLKHFGNVG